MRPGLRVLHARSDSLPEVCCALRRRMIGDRKLLLVSWILGLPRLPLRVGQTSLSLVVVGEDMTCLSAEGCSLLNLVKFDLVRRCDIPGGSPMLRVPERNYPDDSDRYCLLPGGLAAYPLLLLRRSPPPRLWTAAAKTADGLLAGPSAFHLLLCQQRVFDGAEVVGAAAMNRQTGRQEVEALVEC